MDLDRYRGLSRDELKAEDARLKKAQRDMEAELADVRKSRAAIKRLTTNREVKSPT